MTCWAAVTRILPFESDPYIIYHHTHLQCLLQPAFICENDALGHWRTLDLSKFKDSSSRKLTQTKWGLNSIFTFFKIFRMYVVNNYPQPTIFRFLPIQINNWNCSQQHDTPTFPKTHISITNLPPFTYRNALNQGYFSFKFRPEK